MPTTLDRRIDRWVEEGIVSPEQGEAIRAFEDDTGRSVPIVAEALGYLGASLAVVAAVVAAEEWWADLETWGRVTVVALASAATLAGGWWIRLVEQPAVQRLASFLWLLSVIGAATATGIAFEPGGPDEVAVTAAITTGYAAALWWRRRRALQLAAVFVPFLTTIASTLAIGNRIEVPFIGLAVWGVALAWLLVAETDRIQPKQIAQGLGGIALLAGAQCTAIEPLQDVGLVLALVTAVALLVASVAAGSTVLLAAGAIATFVFVPEAIVVWFADTLGVPIALFLVGLALLGAALVTARLKREVTDA